MEQKIYTLVRMDTGFGSTREYETTISDIRKCAVEYGRANDVLELYDADGILVARAIWPMGSKRYLYSYGKLLDVNPVLCRYIP